ncbi:BTB/POZ domain-containing protein [Spatholobus suberectus]|nr:BTB/POZ domain-containing protein [Spatholobus suberectus]
MKLKEIEKSSIRSTSSSPVIYASHSADKPPLPRKSFINSVSKKLGRLSPFLRGDAATTPLKGRAGQHVTVQRHRHYIFPTTIRSLEEYNIW